MRTAGKIRFLKSNAGIRSDNKIPISYIAPQCQKSLRGFCRLRDNPERDKYMEGIKVRNKTRRKTIVIDGVHYFVDKPEICRKCLFWKNRKAGCILGTENCYYLAEVIKTEQEKKCEN